MDKGSSLGMPMSPQEISKRYKRQSLGMPRGIPSSSTKNRSPFKTLYFYCFVFYAFFLGASLLSLSVFFCFVCCNKRLDPNIFLLKKTHSIFCCQEHSSFHYYRSTSVLFFLVLHLAFIFRLDFCSDLIIYFYQGVFIPLVYVGFHLK
jgi:hypothetical protein